MMKLEGGRLALSLLKLSTHIVSLLDVSPEHA